jgi:hypothetical protein
VVKFFHYLKIDCRRRRVHTLPFRTLIKGMYPFANTLPKQHTPSLQAKLDPPLQGGVVDFRAEGGIRAATA